MARLASRIWEAGRQGREVAASMARGAKDDVSARALESSGRVDSLYGKHALTIAGDPNETALRKARGSVG